MIYRTYIRVIFLFLVRTHSFEIPPLMYRSWLLPSDLLSVTSSLPCRAKRLAFPPATQVELTQRPIRNGEINTIQYNPATSSQSGTQECHRRARGPQLVLRTNTSRNGGTS